MASVVCRVQFLDDSDPFICTNFPEPRRPPTVSLEEDVPLSEQVAGIHKLLEAPLKLEDCALQVSPPGNYLDLDSSLLEQKDELENFYEDLIKGKKPLLILRTQLSVRVHAILEKLYNSQGPELRRSLFSLKQLFQDDEDLVPEFVACDGLMCFIRVGAEADHNYQNYILRALSQIMLFVDGMNGVIQHNETLQWLYTLTGSQSRLLVKTSLKLLIVFVEYSESNGPRLITAVNAVDSQRGARPWSYIMEVLEERNGSDTELLMFAVTLINKTLAVLPDQDSFYDVTDSLEQLGMERIMEKHMKNLRTEPDLRTQFSIYEAALKHEDGEVDDSSVHLRKERRKTAAADQDGRRSRRLSSQAPQGGSVPAAPRHRSPTSQQPWSSPPAGAVTDEEPKSPSSLPLTPLCVRVQPLVLPFLGCSGSVWLLVLVLFGFLSLPLAVLVSATRSRSFLSHHMSALGLSRKSRLFSRTSTEEPPAARWVAHRTSPGGLGPQTQRNRLDQLYLHLIQRVSSQLDQQQSSSKTESKSSFKLEYSSSNNHPPLAFHPSFLQLSGGGSVLVSTPPRAESMMGNDLGGPGSSPSVSFRGPPRKPRQTRPQEVPVSTAVAPLHAGRWWRTGLCCLCRGFWLLLGVVSVLVIRPPAVARVSPPRPPAWCLRRRSPGCHLGRVSMCVRVVSRVLSDGLCGPCRDTFLRSLAAAQWDKKRRSKHLSETRESLSDDIRGPDTPPAEGGGATPQASSGRETGSAVLVTIVSTQMDTQTATARAVRLTHNPLLLPRLSVRVVGRPPVEPSAGCLPAGARCPPAVLWVQPQLPPPPQKKETSFLVSAIFQKHQAVTHNCQRKRPPPTHTHRQTVTPAVGRSEPSLPASEQPEGLLVRTQQPQRAQRLPQGRAGGSGWVGPGSLTRLCFSLFWPFFSLCSLQDVSLQKGPETKKSVLLVLDPKRSNAINIGMTVLPAVHVIKAAILSFDEFAISKEGIEEQKILTMVPTEEEKLKIQEAQLANPDVPLGTAEHFLSSLASISALTPRLQLWAFKLNYEALEKVWLSLSRNRGALFDLKLGMEQLAFNKTFRRILATLLAIGNFLNSSNAKGFELSYLEKVVEVKDTVHRQSLLYHTCSQVVENYPESSDVYSEVPAVTRSAKVDFEVLAENLVQLERRCKASWDHLKVVTKHETKAALKAKLTEFLKDCTQRVTVLKVVHRRVVNRFHSFLLFLGQPSSSVRDIKVTTFCRIISEFSLEYRTTRERVLTRKHKRAAHRERTKTRGKMITETEKFSGAVPQPDSLSPVSLATEPGQEEEHQNMKTFLTSGPSLSVQQGGLRRSRAVRSLGRVSPSVAREEGNGAQDDATDDIMDRLVQSVTQNPSDRQSSPKNRKRSRVNRKSLRRTLKSGLSLEVVQALGLNNKTEDRV
uniref:Formin homology 2 domain containing 1 n=2 Tax=Tetraodon nigroviridis TaxID=99883 RepID=H3C7S3_TETNG